ncbi:hypothetical protein TRICHSKD4_4517 [Roseibium sp. TrichSKD4]|nr:hypothetical protein TRICHSKD4_4517 [Roseibium sp. TrichSKD4]
MQTSNDVLLQENLIGAIVPRPYFDDADVKSCFKQLGIDVKHYDLYPLKSEHYVAEIYSLTVELYKKLGRLE